METGFKRNLLAELLDSVGRGVLLMALGIGWFVFLWGLNLPALLAGIALGTQLLLLRRLYRQTTLVRRETALRCRIGGELLLEKMLFLSAPMILWLPICFRRWPPWGNGYRMMC